MIMAGNIIVDGQRIDKAGSLVDEGALISIVQEMPYVGRGGLKLEAAIREFNIDVGDKVVMDIGASTGGFTDCLIQHGAKRVYAIDVGYGQLHWRLRNDPRIILMEKTNIRHLSADKIPEKVDMVTIDVSFISLTKVLPKVMDFIRDKGEVIALIKPQFEVGKGEVGKGGVVKDEGKRVRVLEAIKIVARGIGLDVIGIMQSPIKGPKGNIEYLIYLRNIV